MSDFETRLAADLSQGREYREAYSEAFGNEYLATQIQMLRKQHGWTQAELGQRIGSNQGRVSVYEDEEYGKWSLDTLRKIASVFGVWVKISFESYGSLVHEAAHFQPQQLLRADFENDPDVRRWLELHAPPGGEDRTLRMVLRWAADERPSRADLIDWLQGFGLPDFDGRESTPVQHLLQSVPESEERAWNVMARELARLVSSGEEEAAPLVRNAPTYRENLFSLAKALGPRAELQEGLDAVYRQGAERLEREGRSGLGDEAVWLLEAMIRNQVDARWEPIWKDYLKGGERSDDSVHPGRSFLPGRGLMGIRGLLGMPQSDGYWIAIARGVRDLERRLVRQGYASLDRSPDVLDELGKAIGLVFDWWPDPRSAQALLQGSIALMSEGTWSTYAQAAWAYGVCRRPGWPDAVRTGNNEQERKTYADVLAGGSKFYTEWQLMRGSSKPSAEIEQIQKDSEESSLAVIAAA